jgi:hypothetical protein
MFSETAVTVTVVVLLIAILLLALLGLYLLWRVLRRLSRLGPPGQGAEPCGPGQPSIPDQLKPNELSPLLQSRLAGTPASGIGSGATGPEPTTVVWVDRGDEVAVHLDGVKTEIAGDCVLVSIDLETDQTGRTPLVVAFALGSSGAAGLVVATDEYPRGNAVLAARWGPAVQAAAWSALLSVAADHATERGLAPQGLAVADGQLKLLAAAPLTVS